jgi:protein-S-isoprenylcysteine O-methyltransferase Ste14
LNGINAFIVPSGFAQGKVRARHFAEISSDEVLNTPILKHDSNSSSETSPLILGLSKALDRSWKRSKDYTRSIFSEDFGTRGEQFIFAQLFCAYSIMMGHIPLLKHFVETLFGPILFACGVFTTIASVLSMNKAFTAYTSPVAKEIGGHLVTFGCFKYVRHPIYAGTLSILMGFSIMTNSAVRLLFTAIYYVLIDLKSDTEEQRLKKMYGNDYEEYKRLVPHKFLPISSLKSMIKSSKSDTTLLIKQITNEKVNGEHSHNSDDNKQPKKRLFP